MARKPLISVRVPEEILEKIENTGISKATIVNQALAMYFDINGLQSKTQNEENGISAENQADISLSKQLDEKDGQIREKDDQIKRKDEQIMELTKLLDQAQQLQLHTQKLIPEDVAKKPWWFFWKSGK